VSVENFDGTGLSDQPGIVYGFTDTADTDGLPDYARSLLSSTTVDHSADVEIRELSRSGRGQPGPSRGDVVERDRTKSTLETRLPELDLPGQDGKKYDNCGDNIPAFACLNHPDNPESEGCGKPVYIGRSCASPTCSRDWPTSIKRKVLRYAGRLDSLSRILHKRTGEPIDQNHVVASLPGFLVDSDQPVERALVILQELLKYNWGIEGFAAIYHPFRIKQKFRKDQYSHGGAEGEGEMTWKDVLTEDDPYQYLKYEPHFHLFFPARRGQFSYSVVPAVFEHSGWVFHRITKRDDDCNVSVGKIDEDGNSISDSAAVLDDLTKQLTYCLSHAGVNDWNADRSELTTRMKGQLATDVEFVPDQTEDQVLAAFCDAAPALLGTRFTNMADATCDAEVGETDIDAASDSTDDSDESPENDKSHPLYETWNPDDRAAVSSDPGEMGNPWPDASTPRSSPRAGGADDGWWGSHKSSSQSGAQTRSDRSDSAGGSDDDAGADTDDETKTEIKDDRQACHGSIRPMHEAGHRLDEPEWCQQAEHVSELRDAYQEYSSFDDHHPHVPDDDDNIPEVVPPD